MPQFSVVIPLYNKESSIKKTIQSVLNQTFGDFELLVINDGSTDRSVDVVNSMDDKRIRLIIKVNGGVSSARNKGIQESKANWIAFIDGDDLWEPNYLEGMYSFIMEFPEAKMFGCAFDNMEGDRYSARNFYLPNNFKGIIHNYFIHAKMNLLFWPSSTIVSRLAIESVGGFDERISMGEDIDLWIRIGYKNSVAFYNTILTHYNQDAPNRAMKRKHEFKKNYLFYTAKFKDWEKENPIFRDFINFNRLGHTVEVFKNYSHLKSDVKSFLKQIDLTNQPLKYRMFLKMPFFIQKMIVQVIY